MLVLDPGVSSAAQKLPDCLDSHLPIAVVLTVP